ncbi:hypothetical protein AB4305_33965 [Nocardia sp. 2YAB30]|uniref:hypothetical protein n=1 Tax=Nocardia sp. 2YAB30 TaxID=3233022 RepID=UPI003F950657
MPTALLIAFTVASVLYGTICYFDRPVKAATRCHAAPDTPYSVDGAHLVWQARINCDIETCADKAAALAVLTANGRVRPWAVR